MTMVVYLVIAILGGSGVTSQKIPQANMAQCQANAKSFNTDTNQRLVSNEYSSMAKAQKAICIVGVKE